MTQTGSYLVGGFSPTPFGSYAPLKMGEFIFPKSNRGFQIIQIVDNCHHLDVSKNRGFTPKWMVKIMENPYFLMDDLGENPTIFRENTHLEIHGRGNFCLQHFHGKSPAARPWYQ